MENIDEHGDGDYFQNNEENHRDTENIEEHGDGDYFQKKIIYSLHLDKNKPSGIQINLYLRNHQNLSSSPCLRG